MWFLCMLCRVLDGRWTLLTCPGLLRGTSYPGGLPAAIATPAWKELLSPFWNTDYIYSHRGAWPSATVLVAHIYLQSTLLQMNWWTYFFSAYNPSTDWVMNLQKSKINYRQWTLPTPEKNINLSLPNASLYSPARCWFCCLVVGRAENRYLLHLERLESKKNNTKMLCKVVTPGFITMSKNLSYYMYSFSHC